MLFEMKRKENMGIRKTTWRHIRRYPYQAFAAIFIITQTFFVISLFTFGILGSAKVISYFESLPQVTAFFKNEAKQEQMDGLRTEINTSGKVEKITFVSKQEALKRYQQKFKDDPMLLEFVTADILPASLEIQTKEMQDLDVIAETLRKSPHVKEVIFPKDVIEKLSVWTDALRKIGIALIVVLSLNSIFIMTIIIGIKISQKKDEIEIMRLVGATGSYVRWPFIFEGVFYGVVGAIIGWALATGTLLYTSQFLETFLQGIPLFPVSSLFLAELLGIEMLFAIFLGVIASFLAVLRYLR